jgi:hypothetical protein
MSNTSNALASSRSVKLMITALLGLGLSACAAQVEGDESDEGEGEVAQSAGALNRAFDFQLGIMAIRYNSRGQALKSSQGWTNPISYYNGYGNAKSESDFTSPFPGATGFRVAIKALGGAGSGPLFTDFRMRFQVRNSVTGETAPVGTTGWISECAGNGIECMHDIFEPFTNFNERGWDQFNIGYDVRWWPTSNSSNEITDFKLLATACSTDVEATCIEPNYMYTKWLSEMAPGEISWSHTAAPSDEGVLAFVEAGFISHGTVAK